MSDTLVHRRRGIRLELMAIGLAVSAPAMAAMVYMPNVWLSGLMMLVFGRPLLEKLDIVKQKYGMMEDENGI